MVLRDARGQFLAERRDLVVPRAIRHGQVRGVALPAEGHALHFDERRFAERDELGVTCAQINQRVECSRRWRGGHDSAGGEEAPRQFDFHTGRTGNVALVVPLH